ncbi:hypothetical protein N5T82_05840 [Aliarcobacter cryaerophilus]|uniref:hypothetical protein n=1 Tax=Aliarcobacter cryaerophilus TaxID=28198 RepID=UPI0021B60B2B|nr:hypothetical protein [Aliarcobacter cryaerophilus]MCT7539355.1 hypothetical protein [Aliarcobacter cryaerophilus]
MKYNFDKVINRKNTDCYKWDTTKDGVIPMWVADMDFEVAKPIVDSIIKRAKHQFLDIQWFQMSILKLRLTGGKKDLTMR